MIRFCYTCGGPTDDCDREEIIEALVAHRGINLAERLANDWWDPPPTRIQKLLANERR
jgi:hypothetical protein